VTIKSYCQLCAGKGQFETIATKLGGRGPALRTCVTRPASNIRLNVCVWPKADIQLSPSNVCKADIRWSRFDVRYWMKSGHTSQNVRK